MPQRTANVAVGSLADIPQRPPNVRFPESGHWLRRRYHLNQQFKRTLCERVHVAEPLGIAGAQRDRTLRGTRNRDAGVAGRIAVTVAGRSGGAGFAKPPDRAVALAHAP